MTLLEWLLYFNRERGFTEVRIKQNTESGAGKKEGGEEAPYLW